jgi:hypothetical protein
MSADQPAPPTEIPVATDGTISTQDVVNAIAVAADAVIAPEHEARLAKIEHAIEEWAPLLVKLAAIAEKAM